MSKSSKNSLVIIVIALFVFGVLFAVYQGNKAEPMDANTSKDNVLEDANTGFSNMLNTLEDMQENDEKNEQINGQEENREQNVQNTNKTEEAENKEQNKVTNTQSSNQSSNDEKIEENKMTPRESKAIELAKEKWKEETGSLEDVSFNVSVQSDGKYGVTVYDITTTQSIEFYIVDVDTGLVKER